MSYAVWFNNLQKRARSLFQARDKRIPVEGPLKDSRLQRVKLRALRMLDGSEHEP